MFAPTVSLVPGGTGIRSLPAIGKARAPRTPTALYPRCHNTARLYLNTFRGEPAISRFDWYFTPTHSSSEPFVTDTSSALHVLLRTLQPDHGLLTWFRVYPMRLRRPIQTRCRCGSAYCSLSLATPGNSSVHTPKGTRSGCPSHGLSATDFRVSFTPLAGVLFTVPSRYYALSVDPCI
jgi:hypothetical protein